jgi:hypothetical protein
MKNAAAFFIDTSREKLSCVPMFAPKAQLRL